MIAWILAALIVADLLLFVAVTRPQRDPWVPLLTVLFGGATVVISLILLTESLG